MPPCRRGRRACPPGLSRGSRWGRSARVGPFDRSRKGIWCPQSLGGPSLESRPLITTWSGSRGKHLISSPHGKCISTRLAGSPGHGYCPPCFPVVSQGWHLIFPEGPRVFTGHAVLHSQPPWQSSYVLWEETEVQRGWIILFVRGFIVDEVEWAYHLGLLIPSPFSPHNSLCGSSAFRTVGPRFRFSQQLIITLRSKTFWTWI